MEIFAKRMRELRKEKNVSQSQLAEALGVNQKTISSYERNYYEPPQEILVKIAEFFGVSVDYLLGLVDY